jgi:hypothetical protein
MAVVLSPCGNKYHYAWSFGSIVGPIYQPTLSLYDCFCGYFSIEDDGGNEGFYLSFPLSVGCNTNGRFQISGTRGGTVSDRVTVNANGVQVYDSGCGATDFDSGVLNIPSGTTYMEITVEARCSGTDTTYWSFLFGATCA